MIRHIEDAEVLKTLAFLQEDPLFPRLTVNAAAYGLSSPFFDLWVQQTGEEPVAVMGRLDGQMTLVARDGFDAGELALFLQAVGFETLLCKCAAARRLPFFRAQTAVVLRREKPVSPAERALVDAMSGALQKAGRRVFLLRDASENEAFYRSLGFEPLEECAFLRPNEEGKANGQQTAF